MRTTHVEGLSIAIKAQTDRFLGGREGFHR